VNKINFTEKLKKSQDINAEVQKLIKSLPCLPCPQQAGRADRAGDTISMTDQA